MRRPGCPIGTVLLLSAHSPYTPLRAHPTPPSELTLHPPQSSPCTRLRAHPASLPKCTVERLKEFRETLSILYPAVNYTQRTKVVNTSSSSHLPANAQAEGACKCNGWKSQNPPPTPPRTDQQSNAVNLQDPCRSCSHTLGMYQDRPKHGLN